MTTCTLGNAWPFTGSTYVPVSDRVEDPARRLPLADVTAEGCPEDRDDQGGGFLVQEVRVGCSKAPRTRASSPTMALNSCLLWVVPRSRQPDAPGGSRPRSVTVCVSPPTVRRRSRCDRPRSDAVPTPPADSKLALPVPGRGSVHSGLRIAATRRECARHLVSALLTPALTNGTGRDR